MTEQYDSAEDYFDLENPFDVARLRAAVLQIRALAYFGMVEVRMHNAGLRPELDTRASIIEAQNDAAKAYAAAREALEPDADVNKARS